jgi:hypothetical protein
MCDLFKVRFRIRFGIGCTSGGLFPLCCNGKEFCVTFCEKGNVCAEIQRGFSFPYDFMSGFLSNLEASRDHADMILCM